MAIVTGLAVPVLLGFAGLALEYGTILGVRAQAQRTADFASHAGAVAYSRSGDEAQMISAARGVAELNGFSAAEIVVSLDASVPTASGAAVRATITTPKSLYLPRIVGSNSSVDVVASAVSGSTGGASACVQALDPGGTGITLSGGTALQSSDCGIASNAGVVAPCGTSIVAEAVSYDSDTAPWTNGCNTITDPSGGAADIVRRPTPDPLAGTSAIMLAQSRMADTELLEAPADVVVGTAPNIEFGWNANATRAQAQAIGCTATFNNGPREWLFSCPGLSTVNIGNLTIGGGLRLNFNPGASSAVVYNFSGSIRNTGTQMTFPGGVYNIALGIITGGGSVTEFGAGTYRIGRSTHSCDGQRYSICNTSQLTFAGPSSFVLTGGFRNTGGSVLTLGTGDANSFQFGPSSGGDAISLGGGSQTFMGDARAGVFEMAGHVNGGGGGSCFVVPRAPLHEIRGSLLASGAVRFGAGLYVVDGYVHIGGNGGGSASCGGATISIHAPDTTFLISANGTAPSGWECRDQAYCVSAGYSNIRMTAPESGPFADMAVIGPLDPTRTDGARFTAGASGAVVSGAFYFPNGPITASGGASASGGSGGCLQLIGSEITLSGGTSLASECDIPQSGGSGRVVILR
ncbi:MAG: TadE/TadG family type IV pilus assembly protein [Pelagibaca sp.]